MDDRDVHQEDAPGAQDGPQNQEMYSNFGVEDQLEDGQQTPSEQGSLSGPPSLGSQGAQESTDHPAGGVLDAEGPASSVSSHVVQLPGSSVPGQLAGSRPGRAAHTVAQEGARMDAGAAGGGGSMDGSDSTSSGSTVPYRPNQEHQRRERGYVDPRDGPLARMAQGVGLAPAARMDPYGGAQGPAVEPLGQRQRQQGAVNGLAVGQGRDALAQDHQQGGAGEAPGNLPGRHPPGYPRDPRAEEERRYTEWNARQDQAQLIDQLCRMMVNEDRRRKDPPRSSGHTKPRIFSGKQDYQDYITTFEMLADRCNWDAQERQYQLQMSLEGDALQVIGNAQRVEHLDYEGMKDVLRRRFDPEDNRTISQAELEARTRRPKETVREYGDSLLRLALKACGNGTQAEFYALTVFKRNVSTDRKLIAKLHRKNFASLSQAVATVVRYESSEAISQKVVTALPAKPSRGNAVQEKEQTAKVAPKKGARKTTPSTGVRTCYNCKSPDHFIAACPKPLKPGLSRRRQAGRTNRQDVPAQGNPATTSNTQAAEHLNA